MNSIIKISPYEIGGVEVNSVNARELHEALGVKKKFADWIKPKLADAMLDEGVDFLALPLKGKREIGATMSIEYILTLDTAKHIAMMSRTLKGKEVRAYFIEVEKRSREAKPAQGVELALVKSLEEIARGITVLAGSMKSMEERITALETVGSPLKNRRVFGGGMVERIGKLVELTPGINQSQLCRLLGFRRDDKAMLRLLRDFQGVLWEAESCGTRIFYYPLGFLK